MTYRLISCGTVEERQYGRQIFKGGLERAIMGGGGGGTRSSSGEWIVPTRVMSRRELAELFTLGSTTTSDTAARLQQSYAPPPPVPSSSIAQHLEELTCGSARASPAASLVRSLIAALTHHDYLLDLRVDDADARAAGGGGAEGGNSLPPASASFTPRRIMGGGKATPRLRTAPRRPSIEMRTSPAGAPVSVDLRSPVPALPLTDGDVVDLRSPSAPPSQVLPTVASGSEVDITRLVDSSRHAEGTLAEERSADVTRPYEDGTNDSETDSDTSRPFLEDNTPDSPSNASLDETQEAADILPPGLASALDVEQESAATLMAGDVVLNSPEARHPSSFIDAAAADDSPSQASISPQRRRKGLSLGPADAIAIMAAVAQEAGEVWLGAAAAEEEAHRHVDEQDTVAEGGEDERLDRSALARSTGGSPLARSVRGSPLARSTGGSPLCCSLRPTQPSALENGVPPSSDAVADATKLLREALEVLERGDASPSMLEAMQVQAMRAAATLGIMG